MGVLVKDNAAVKEVQMLKSGVKVRSRDRTQNKEYSSDMLIEP